MLWDTGVPLFFIPASFIHYWWHVPIDALYNMIWVGSWAGSALVAFITCLRLTRSRLGAFMGHLAVLLSAYENTESLSHLDLMWLGFLFLFFMMVYEWMVGRRPTSRLLVWGSLLSAAQWLANEELLAMMWIAAIIGIAIYEITLFMSGQSTRAHRHHTIRGLLTLVGTACAVLLPLVWFQLHTPLQPLNSARFAGYFGIDLQNVLLVPVHVLWHGGSVLHWAGDIDEDCGYLGFPLIAGICTYWLGYRRQWNTPQRVVVRSLLFWFVTLVILSLGAYIHWAGRSSAWGSLPGLFFYFLPLLHDLVLPRFMAIAFWALGVGIALVFSRWDRLSPTIRVVSFAVMGLILLTWFPRGYGHVTTQSADQRVIPTILETNHAPPHPTVLVFPYDNVGDPTHLMLLQSQNHFSYRLAEGYLGPNDALLTHFTPLIAAWDNLDAHARNPDDSVAPFPARQWRHATGEYLLNTRPFALIVLHEAPAFRENVRWWTALLGPASRETSRAVYWVHPRVQGKVPVEPGATTDHAKVSPLTRPSSGTSTGSSRTQ